MRPTTPTILGDVLIEVLGEIRAPRNVVPGERDRQFGDAHAVRRRRGKDEIRDRFRPIELVQPTRERVAPGNLNLRFDEYRFIQDEEILYEVDP